MSRTQRTDYAVSASGQLELEQPLAFISYAREDRAKATDIYDRLRRLNLRPWLDQHHLVAGQDANVVLTHLSGNMGYDLMAILELNSEHGIWQGVDDRAFHRNDVFFCHGFCMYCLNGFLSE